MYKKINNFYRFCNRSDFIQFVNDTKEDFDCEESWEYNFGFQLNWDEDTGEILETLDEWLQDKNNRMKYEPESYPCTCYYLNETKPDRFGDAKCFIFDYVEDKEFSCNNEKEVDVNE